MYQPPTLPAALFTLVAFVEFAAISFVGVQPVPDEALSATATAG